MKIVFFGTPEFAVLPLRTLLKSEYKVTAVVTQPDKKVGRGRHISHCPVKIEAIQAGLKILQPPEVRDKNFIAELESLGPSLIVVAAYGQILPSEILRLPEFGCVNIHASLLPKYRGAAPINWAIINGEDKTGITMMLMDEGMDTGPILLQKDVIIEPDDTAGSLSERLSKTGADLIVSTISGLKDGSVKARPQDGEATYAPLLKKKDGHIMWSKSAVQIRDFIRGMNPWPGAYSFIDDERYKILRAVPVESAADISASDKEREPGSIARADKEGMLVRTGRGGLSILEIQPSGKPVMPVRAFLQGRRVREGMRFV